MGKKTKSLDRKPKINLIFDANKRKEFLCGFRKRKLERKQKAQEELKLKLKEEKKRIKHENKEMYKKLVVSSRPLPDIEQLLKEEYEDNDVNVKIVELSSDILQKRDLVIGPNKSMIGNKSAQSKNEITKKTKFCDNSLPGMSSDVEKEESEPDSDEDKSKTRKEIKKIIKKQATTKVKKSKVFQLKNKMERSNNRKLSRNKQKSTEKNKNNKNSKSKHKNKRKKH